MELVTANTLDRSPVHYRLLQISPNSTNDFPKWPTKLTWLFSSQYFYKRNVGAHTRTQAVSKTSQACSWLGRGAADKILFTHTEVKTKNERFTYSSASSSDRRHRREEQETATALTDLLTSQPCSTCLHQRTQTASQSLRGLSDLGSGVDGNCRRFVHRYRHHARCWRAIAS